jgi:hypothetical protein
MVLLDEPSDLRCNFGAIPAHYQHLANGPVKWQPGLAMICSVAVRELDRN